MNSSQINTTIGVAGCLLALHLTAACVLCFVLGALFYAAMMDGEE